MDNRLQRPTDPYDPAWVEFRRQNPGLRLSLSAADPGDGGDGGEAFDWDAFLPDQFKGEDGKHDTEAFRNSYDDLVTFKSQSDEARAALPTEASGYEFALPEDYQMPEGFDPKSLAHKDDDGNEIEFDPASMIKQDDPDIPLLQDLMHRIGQGEVSPVDAMKSIAGIVASRELRAVMSGQEEAAEHIKALGPEGKARIATMTRTLNARLKPEQAEAVLDGITSADGLRGLEALVKKSGSDVPPAPSGKDLDDMSNDELIAEGMKRAMAG